MSDNNPPVDPAIIELFQHYISQEFSIQNPESELTINENENKRFFLQLSMPETSGKYGGVTFWHLKDRTNDEHRKFAVKKNKGIDMADACMVTSIESKVLNILKKKDLPVVDCCLYEGDLLLMRHLEGKTVENYILENGGLPPDIVLSIIDTMPKIHSALEEMMKGGSGISSAEVQFIRERNFGLIKKDFPTISDEDLRNNFYSYRVMHALGRILPGFTDAHRNINDTLKNAKKIWVGYDHPRNRILRRMSDSAPYRVIAYDFNHISQEFFGLDLAMLLSSFAPEPQKSQGIESYFISLLNYSNLAIMTNYLERNKQKLPEDQVQGIRAYIQKIRDPGITTRYVQPIENFYAEHDDVVIDSACMYAAFLHRNTLDLIKLINKGDERSLEKAAGYVNLLRFTNSMSSNFERDVDEYKKRDVLQKAGVALPLLIAPLKNIDEIKALLEKPDGSKS